MSSLSSSRSAMKQSPKRKLKKAPQAPRRFKSAYMFFSTWKHKDIREQFSKHEKIQTPEVAKMVSISWKQLSDEQRAPWDEMARKDKARFELEKSLYDGPWKVPDVKDPLAPKRPVSAFLLFSKAKRNLVKREGRYKTTTEISTVLSKMWKEASAEERKKYLDRDMEDRKRYKKELLEYERIASAGRCEREALAARVIDDETCAQNHNRVDMELSQVLSAAEPQSSSSEPLQGAVAAAAASTASPGRTFVAEWEIAAPKRPSSGVEHNCAAAQGNLLTETRTAETPEPSISPPFDVISLPTLQGSFSADANDAPMRSRRDLFDDFTKTTDNSVTGDGAFDARWEPIPWDAPVADFDACSGGGDDYAISPIATRSIMMDTCPRLVTPARHSALPSTYVNIDRHHRLPMGYNPPCWDNHQGYGEQAIPPYGDNLYEHQKASTVHQTNGQAEAMQQRSYSSASKYIFGQEEKYI